MLRVTKVIMMLTGNLRFTSPTIKIFIQHLLAGTKKLKTHKDVFLPYRATPHFRNFRIDVGAHLRVVSTNLRGFFLVRVWARITTRSGVIFTFLYFTLCTFRGVYRGFLRIIFRFFWKYYGFFRNNVGFFRNNLVSLPVHKQVRHISRQTALGSGTDSEESLLNTVRGKHLIIVIHRLVEESDTDTVIDDVLYRNFLNASGFEYHEGYLLIPFEIVARGVYLTQQIVVHRYCLNTLIAYQLTDLNVLIEIHIIGEIIKPLLLWSCHNGYYLGINVRYL